LQIVEGSSELKTPLSTQNIPRQNIGQKKLRKKKKKNTQVIYLGWIPYLTGLGLAHAVTTEVEEGVQRLAMRASVT
jgi:hypothetical protein